MKDHAYLLKLEKQRLCIIEGNGCGEQMLSVAKLRIDCRFAQMPEIQPGPIPEHLSKGFSVWIIQRMDSFNKRLPILESGLFAINSLVSDNLKLCASTSSSVK